MIDFKVQFDWHNKNQKNQQEKIIASDFKLIAPQYNDLKRSHAYDYHIIKFIQDLSPKRVLEVGCGIGSLTDLLSQFVLKVVAVDINSSMIEIAKSQVCSNNVEFSICGCDQMDVILNGQKFDLIVAKFLLHDYPDPTVFIRKWADLLNENGRILIVDRYTHKSVFKRMIAYINLEFWLLKNFLGITKSISTSIKWLYKDLLVWHSTPWRLHRKHEYIMSYSVAKKTYESVCNDVIMRKINCRSFLMIGRIKLMKKETMHPNEQLLI